MDDIKKMDSIRMDVLKELGNIGAGNAVTSVSKLLNRKVEMVIPKVTMVDFKDIADILGGPETLIIGVLVKISGDVNGMMLFCIEQKTAHLFVNNLLGREYGSYLEFTEMELSVLKEIGNIVTSAYLGSLATLIDKKIKPSVPFLSIDMAGAILSVPAIEFGKISDHVLFIESVFQTFDEDVSGYFLLIPDIASFDVILKSLGV